MLLSNLTAPNKGETFVDRDIRGITDDSRLVKPGYLFIAVTGAQQDGRAFIKSAIERGATAVVMEPTLDPIENFVPPDANVAILTVLDTRYAQSYIAARFYPRQPRMIAAVTGTSGKTSTAQFARELWQLDGRNAASIGTLGLVTAKESRYGSLTTPGALALHQILDEIAGQGVTHLALEASSHGIELHRLDHVKMRVAAFTNLSRDHLDFHADMEAYLAAKTKLFTELMPQGNTAVLNADIPEFEALNRACLAQGHRVISYGAKGRDIKLLAHRPQPQGQDLKLSVCGKVHNILLPIIGEFQIWNSLCALGMAIGSGGDADQTVAAMEKLSGVPGRLQKVGTSAQGGTVFVDYAHKPGALENVLTGLRPHVAAHPGQGCMSCSAAAATATKASARSWAASPNASPTTSSSPTTTRAAKTPPR